MDEKLQQEFIQFLGNQLKAKDQKDLENKVKNLSKEDLKKYYDAFVEYKKNQKVKAAFGAKLNYIKALKNECAEDEKLVIFKSGGKTGCGCKKLNIGGETPKKQTSEQKPKKPVIWTKKDDAKLDSLTRRELLKQPLTPQGKLDLKNLRKKWKEASNKEQFELEAKKGGKLNKDCGGSAIVKSFKAKCGTKMKKHQQGGSLNGIPFMQKSGKLPTAPKVEDRYKRGYKYGYTVDGSLYLFPKPYYTKVNVSGVRTDYPFMSNQGGIKRTVFYTGNTPTDTTYTEIPNAIFPVKRKMRYASSENKTPEYETLKRRFNTAWNIAK